MVLNSPLGKVEKKKMKMGVCYVNTQEKAAESYKLWKLRE